MTYKILRPPLDKTYKLPSRKALLKLDEGNVVKLTFQTGGEQPERMWVKLEDISKPDQWTGIVDNDPAQTLTANELPAGTRVTFHPLDIIAIY